jgi:hypothetical protein
MRTIRTISLIFFFSLFFFSARSAIRLEADVLNIIRCTSGEATPANLANDGYAAPGAFTGDLTLHWRNADEIGSASHPLLRH